MPLKKLLNQSFLLRAYCSPDDGSEKTAKDKAEEREKLEKSMEVKYRFQHIYPVMAKNASLEV